MKSLRGFRQWTQEQLADKAEMSQTQIAKIELGAQRIKLDEACRLAHALGTTVDQMIYGDWSVTVK